MTKPTKWHVRLAKTRISMCIHPVWSESLLSTWRKLGSLATHWAHSKKNDQTVQMPRLIWVFAGHIVILLVLLWGGSIVKTDIKIAHKCPITPRSLSLASHAPIHAISCGLKSLRKGKFNKGADQRFDVVIFLQKSLRSSPQMVKSVYLNERSLW